MQVYDLDEGDLFIWREDMYVVLEQGEDSSYPTQVRRIGTLGVNWRIVDNSHVENFNPYAEIQVEFIFPANSTE